MTSASGHTEPVVIALGSNLGDRAWNLRRAIFALHDVLRIVKVSGMFETHPVDAAPGSPDFLNMAVTGLAATGPHALLRELLAIESRLGRMRQGRNAPRIIDLDLIFYGARNIRSRELTIPHPRYHAREFVLRPLRELNVPWLRAAVQRVP